MKRQRGYDEFQIVFMDRDRNAMRQYSFGYDYWVQWPRYYQYIFCPESLSLGSHMTIIQAVHTSLGQTHIFAVDQDLKPLHYVHFLNRIYKGRPSCYITLPPLLTQFLYCEERQCIIALQQSGKRCNFWVFYLNVEVQSQWYCIFRMYLTDKWLILGCVLGQRYLMCFGATGTDTYENDSQIRVLDLESRMFISYVSSRLLFYGAKNVLHKSKSMRDKIVTAFLRDEGQSKDIPIVLQGLIRKFMDFAGELHLFDHKWDDEGEGIQESILYEELKKQDWSIATESR